MDLKDRIFELAETLEWALDLIDLYDRRLVELDGPEQVYTESHLKGKEKARQVLAQYRKPEQAADV